MQTTLDTNNAARIELDEADGRLHGWGGETVAYITVKRNGPKGPEEARFFVRLRIPDDPRGGKEGDVYAEISTPTNSQSFSRSKEIRATWRRYD